MDTPLPHKPAINKSNESPKSNLPLAGDLPSLRTYKLDVAHAVKDEGTSLVRMVLEDQRAKLKEREAMSPKKPKNLLLIVASVIFLLASAIIIFFIFLRGISPDDKTLENLNVRPLIFVEKNKEVKVDITASSDKEVRGVLLDRISNAKMTLDTIENIFFTETINIETSKGLVEQKNLVSADKLFGFLQTGMPSVLRRALKGEFMFGIHAFNGNEPFFILKTEYYENAFAGMLEWEHRMAETLLPFFNKTDIARELSARKFQDVVIKNKDTRALRDFNNKIVLIYMFKNEQTIIITTNEDTLLELSRRLDISQGKK